MDGHNSEWRFAKPDHTPAPNQRRTTTSAFFFTTAHARILLLDFLNHTFFGLGGPLVHGGMTQQSDLFNQKFLHFISSLERALGIASEREDALNARHHLRMLAELLDQLDFLIAELALDCFSLSHPNCI